MSITFEDGSTLNAESWYRIISLIQQGTKEGKPAATQIHQNGVTIDLKGLEPKANAKIKHGTGPEYSKYIESTYKNWKIRVWRMEKEGVYGVNYFRNEDVRYMEVPFENVRDENGVFKYVQGFVDEI